MVGDTGDAPSDRDFDDSAEVVVLEGAELARDLGESRTQRASHSFRRLAIEWTSVAPDGFEISFSADGSTWSRWRNVAVRHTEVAEHASYLGEVEVPDGGKASHYRLRATRSERPTRIVLRFLASSFDESMEDGEEVGSSARVAFRLPALKPGLVLPRSAWGAQAARCNGAVHAPKRITIHHTVTANGDTNPAGTLRQIQSFHQGTRGWCDVGYHFLISADGRIWEGRPVDRTASHVANNNTNNVGIAFIGTFTTTAPSQAQIAAAAALVSELRAQYGITEAIHGHRHYGGTECPGGALNQVLPMIDGKGGTPPPPPPPTDPDPGQYVLKGVIHQAGNTQLTIAGAKVTVGSASATTDQRGEYELRLAAGTYTVSVTATGYIPTEVTRMLGGGGPATVWGSIGMSKQGGSGTTTGTAGLQGIVYQGTTSNRIGKATVFLDDGRTTTASATGYFRFDGLAARSYTVTASAPGVGSGKVTRTASDATVMWASVAITSTQSTTPPNPTAPSCVGSCGSEAAVPGSSPECYCDDQCQAMGDCCADKATACAAMPVGGSCQGKCGSTTGVGTGANACYCDASCTAYGDCCGDFAGVCSAMPAQSCASRCGSSAPVGSGSSACYCDAYCTAGGDCCSDFAQVCSGSQASSCSGKCGSATPIETSTGLCYCDALCAANGDCCTGYAAACP
jgi:hypothetical protein